MNGDDPKDNPISNKVQGDFISCTPLVDNLHHEIEVKSIKHEPAPGS